MKQIYIFTGGTMNQIAPHLAFASPAFGKVGLKLWELLHENSRMQDPFSEEINIVLVPTEMAIGTLMSSYDRSILHEVDKLMHAAGLKHYIRTNQDLKQVIDYLIEQPDTRSIVMSTAVCDFEAVRIGDVNIPRGGIHQERLDSSWDWALHMTSSEKIIDCIRKERKDIFLVSFKATYNQEEELYRKALSQLKRSSSNLVFGNDIGSKTNIVVTPEEFPYEYGTRDAALMALADMMLKRIDLKFERTVMRESDTRAEVLDLHTNKDIPFNFVPVLQYAIANGAFKPFQGKTTGHFGCVVENQDFQRISSVRKVDHNKALIDGMAKIYIEGDKIEAGGARPSVGEHTQKMIYDELDGKIHSIIHFHCPLRNPEQFEAKRNQFAFECGSFQCGMNTIDGMIDFGNGIWAVHLENHGPNIAFSRDAQPSDIFSFIEEHWDLSAKEGGLVEPKIALDEEA